MRKLLAIAAALGLFAVIVPMQASAAEPGANTPAAKTTVPAKTKAAVVKRKHKRHYVAHVRRGKVRHARRHRRHHTVHNYRTRHHVRHARRHVSPSLIGYQGR
jgi:hypothetical protein